MDLLEVGRKEFTHRKRRDVSCTYQSFWDFFNWLQLLLYCEITVYGLVGRRIIWNTNFKVVLGQSESTTAATSRGSFGGFYTILRHRCIESGWATLAAVCIMSSNISILLLFIECSFTGSIADLLIIKSIIESHDQFVSKIMTRNISVWSICDQNMVNLLSVCEVWQEYADKLWFVNWLDQSDIVWLRRKELPNLQDMEDMVSC